MTIRIDGTNTAANPGITGTDTDTGLQFGTDEVNIVTGGSTRATVDSSGRLGIGNTTPASPIDVVGASSGLIGRFAGTNDGVLQIRNDDTDVVEIGASGSTDQLSFATAGGSEAARFDTSQRLLVGTTSTSATATAIFQGLSSNASFEPFVFLARGSTPGTNSPLGSIRFSDNTHDSAVEITVARNGGTWTSGSSQPTRLMISTTADGSGSPTERVRIDSNGTVFTQATSTGSQVVVTAGANSSNILCQMGHSSTGIVSGTISFKITSNGNVVNTNNSYGSLSDIKLKENIVDASSQWNDLKAIQVRNYNFKEETGNQTHTQIGVIAQEVELVSPGLVTESPDRENVQVPVLDSDGNAVFDENGDQVFTTETRDLGTTTKSVNYSVLYMKAVKALQEAMERIEQLETRVAQLEGGTN